MSPQGHNHQQQSKVTVGGGGFRCTGCGKLLAKTGAGKEVFEIKCPRCGLLNVVLQQMVDQVIITDAEGRILFVNESLERITGYKITDAIGKTPALWGKQMPKAFYTRLWDTIKNKKQSITTELTNRRKDGQLYRVKLRISPVLDTAGEIKFFVGIETKLD